MFSGLPLNAEPWSTKMKRALGAVVFSLGVALPQNGFLAIVSITDYYWSVSPAATLFFHVCNDALPPGIQLDFGKSQELVTPCRTCQIWLCFPFSSWDESFGVRCYFVCEWMRLWVEKVRQWRRLKKTWKKRLPLFRTVTWCQGDTDVSPWREQLYCHFDCVSLLRVWVSRIFDTRWSWWQVTTAFLLFCCSLSAAHRRQK